MIGDEHDNVLMYLQGIVTESVKISWVSDSGLDYLIGKFSLFDPISARGYNSTRGAQVN